MRRLHSARRRSCGALLLDTGFSSGRQEHHDHRRPRHQWTARIAEGMDRRGCSTMRLLSAGTDHGGGGAVGEESASIRRRDHQNHEWEHLPMWYLRSHPARDSPRRQLGRWTMSPLSRREFITAGVAAGAGLVVGFYLPHSSSEKASGSFEPNAYLRITPDDKVTVVVARSEMGQGVRTALPMILAEELEADWKQIEIEQAGASTLFGDQTTGGSASIRTTWDPMRKAGATAREMLISAAALTWGVPRSTCAAENGHIKHAASNRSLSYGDLVAKASTLPIPSDVTLKQSKDYKIVGQRLARVDSPAKVKGEAVFGIDFRMPGMKYAVLSRCPVIGGKVTSFDDKDSKKIAGVSYVGKIADSAVAVVADSVWGAMEGRRVLNVTWDEGPNKDLNSAAVYDSLKKAAPGKAAVLYSVGDVTKISGRKLEASYQTPFMAHAPMEPGNCC